MGNGSVQQRLILSFRTPTFPPPPFPKEKARFPGTIPKDKYRESGLNEELFESIVRWQDGVEIFETPRVVHFLREHPLPVLHNVRRLFWSYTPVPDGRVLQRDFGLYLWAALPSISSVDIDFFESPRRWYMGARDDRFDFMIAMRSLSAELSAGVKAEVIYRGVGMYLEDYYYDKLLVSRPLLVLAFTYDPFSTALRILSQHLTFLGLVRTRLDLTIFWPSEEVGSALPTWPSLRGISIDMECSLPLERHISPAASQIYAKPRTQRFYTPS